MTSSPEHPSWCAQEHTSPCHSRWELWTPLVGLQQVRDEGPPTLHIGTVELPVDQAIGMVTLMEQVHRGDIAAAIVRLMANYGVVVEPVNELDELDECEPLFAVDELDDALLIDSRAGRVRDSG